MMKWSSIPKEKQEAMLKGFGAFEIRKRGVFSHAGPGPKWRYIPKALAPAVGGWRAWDRKEQKFLSDDELLAVPVEAIFDEEFLS